MISKHLLAFALANAGFMLVHGTATVLLACLLMFVIPSWQGPAAAVAVLMSYVMLVPVWSAANMMAARQARAGTLTPADFLMPLRPRVVCRAVMTYWFARAAAAAGLMLLLIPGIVLYCRLLLSLAAVISDEECGTACAVVRSWAVTSGRFVDIYALAAAISLTAPLSAAPLFLGLIWMPPVEPDNALSILTFLHAVLMAVPMGGLLWLYVPTSAVATFLMYSRLVEENK